MKETKRAGFGGLDVQRTPMGTRVTLSIERPGLVIGRKGSTIKALTKAVEEAFGFPNPQIEVQEVENPSLNAQIMAEKLASALERGWHFRRAGHSTVRRIMGAGARGCQVIISGKLTGERHRCEKFKEGHIKYCGEPKLQWMMEGFAIAKVKKGVIGIKVQIMDPNAKLPDEIEIIKVPDEKKEEEKEAIEVKVKKAEVEKKLPPLLQIEKAKKEVIVELCKEFNLNPEGKVAELRERLIEYVRKESEPKKEVKAIEEPKKEVKAIKEPKKEVKAIEEPKEEEKPVKESKEEEKEKGEKEREAKKGEK
jgi:small subunit ribosomal protein S3